MNVLIVFAHPEQRSFCGALKDRAAEELVSQGHEVVISDLYRMGWNPVLAPTDFPERRDPEFFNSSQEQEHAHVNGSTAPDVLAEQEKVTAADLVLFHYPMWWFSMPAIMKGWVDRVLSRGFAYSTGRKYSRGHFRGKRAMVCLTTGTASTLYEPHGVDGDLNHILWPIHNGILYYTGFAVLPPFAAWMPGRVTPELRQLYLIDYAERLRDLDNTEPLYFHPLRDYDETERLKPGIKARSGIQWNPGADQTFQTAADTFTRSERRRRS